MNYGVASSLSWSKTICNPQIDIMRNRGSPRLLPPWKSDHWMSWHAPLTQEQAQHGCLKIYGSLGYPQYEIKVHQKSKCQSVRKVTYPSTILALGGCKLFEDREEESVFISSQVVKRNISRVHIFSILVTLSFKLHRHRWIYVFIYSGSHEVSPLLNVLFSCKNSCKESS